MNQEDFAIQDEVQVELPPRKAPVSNLKNSSSVMPASIALQYVVAMPKPESHLFEVTLRLTNWQSSSSPDALNLKLPVWTPGSYLVREYARHLQSFSAIAEQAGQEHPLSWRKVSKNHWQVETQTYDTVVVRYRVFANDLSVRTNHLDATHGYFNSAALLFYIPGFERSPISVQIVPPHPDWQVATPLPPVTGEPNTFLARDYDTLVDSPFEIGRHQLYEFEALGKPHQLAIWGKGNADPERIIRDTQKVIEVEAALFGGLPYDRYLFLLHLSAQGFGGLEHKDSCSLNYPRLGFRAKEKYDRFMQLVAHEFFHLWNVKRIRPKALEVFDYEQENYTPSLWFSEGTTSFYDLILPYRAGIYDLNTYLNALSKEITRFLMTPGRRVQPLGESSFDAWIKLYRPDANSSNSQVSYYLKGEMVTLLLDLLIRSRHRNQRSFDDVMRQMWQQFGKAEIGFTPAELQSVIETIAGTKLDDFFYRYIETTEELPFNEYFEPFGLRLQPNGDGNQVPHLGMNVKTEHGREMIKTVEADAPAQLAGIDAGDELLAIDGLRVSADQLNDRLKDYQPGQTLEVTVFHQDELRTYAVTLAPPRPTQYHLVTVDRPSRAQEELFAGWLGVSLPVSQN
jgi:predicted metalloprotease with PDZ domain